jgi:peptidoglycan/LPS O-acetylase OafA/YrhL
MGMGATLAYMTFNINGRKTCNIISGICLSILALLALTFHSKNLLFEWGILTVTLSGILILSTVNNSIFGEYFLSNKILAFIGKISYPFYLIHWSLITLSRVFYFP